MYRSFSVDNDQCRSLTRKLLYQPVEQVLSTLLLVYICLNVIAMPSIRDHFLVRQVTVPSTLTWKTGGPDGPVGQALRRALPAGGSIFGGRVDYSHTLIIDGARGTEGVASGGAV